MVPESYFTITHEEKLWNKKDDEALLYVVALVKLVLQKAKNIGRLRNVK